MATEVLSGKATAPLTQQRASSWPLITYSYSADADSGITQAVSLQEGFLVLNQQGLAGTTSAKACSSLHSTDHSLLPLLTASAIPSSPSAPPSAAGPCWPPPHPGNVSASPHLVPLMPNLVLSSPLPLLPVTVLQRWSLLQAGAPWVVVSTPVSQATA